MRHLINRTVVLFAIVVLAALSRLFPHFDNFTPLTAIALFGAAYFTDKRMALFVPILAMFVSDTCLELWKGIGAGFHAGTTVVYTALMLTVVLGFYMLRKVSVGNIVLASLAGSVLFYLLTNLTFVYETNYYPHNLEGMMASYTAAIPFFRNALLGDLFYCGVLFGSFAFFEKLNPALMDSRIVKKP